MTSASFRSLEQTFGGATLRVEYRSISTVEADVLVSSDDTDLSMAGGVSQALLNAGGKSVFLEAQEQAPLPLGGVAITTAGQLRAEKIFHAAVLDHVQGSIASVELIRSVTRTCLSKCDRLELESICFPALATGVAGLSPERSAFAMLMEIAAYLVGPTRIRAVSIALFPSFAVDRSETIARFFAQVTDFLELARRFEGTATASEAMEQAYRKLGVEGVARSAASFQHRMREHRTRWEEALSSAEPGDVQRERGWLVPFEQMESDVLGMPLPTDSTVARMPVTPASAPSAPPPQAIERGRESAPMKSAAPSAPAPTLEALTETLAQKPAPAPSAAPDDWAAIELRCKEERRGMLRALVA
ncbi:MAG: macro domain-containing protein, partial [Byssovorax sp.]